jgi:hypothetical protein
MTRSRNETADSLHDANDALAMTGETFEIVVAWKPGASRPVTLLFLKLNDIAITKDVLDTDSPFTVKIPAALVGQTVNLAWAIAPEVDIAVIAIGLQKRGTTGARKIAANDKGIKRGEIWDDCASFRVE